MIDEELPAVFYDQSGQLVDIQYNAESIQVVNHLPLDSNGRRCPACNAVPMRRTQLVWEEHSRRHGNGTMLLSNLAIRVAPPRRPQPPLRHNVPFGPNDSIFVIALIALVVLIPSAFVWLMALILGRYSDFVTGFSIWLVVMVSGAWLIWGVRRRKKRQQAAKQRDIDDEYTDRLEQYEAMLEIDRADFQTWKQSWFCPSCTTIAVECG